MKLFSEPVTKRQPDDSRIALQSLFSRALSKPGMACRGALAGSISKLVTHRPATRPPGDQSRRKIECLESETARQHNLSRSIPDLDVSYPHNRL
jgi:hypothetical protein